MIRRYFLTVSLAAAALAFSGDATAAADKLKVVASFSILADMVAQVGGDRVEIVTLVGPDGDAHVFEPTPADAKSLADADIVFVNGLGFEGWMDRLVAASGYKGPVVVATAGIEPHEMEGGGHHGEEEHEENAEEAAASGEEHDHEPDPHAWQSVANGKIYVRNILAGLIGADPGNRAAYEAAAEIYLAELDAADAWVKAELAAVPEADRKVITSHDAFGYFASAYGIRFLAPVGISTEDEPSAGELAALIDQIKAEHVKALFVENMSNPKLIEQLSTETGAVVGGQLYADALSEAGGPADTYLKMFQHNVPALKAAMLGL
jgi:zinc/manganese transport system substrate-binding protein